MKLSSETVVALKRLCNATLVNERNFKSMVADYSRFVFEVDENLRKNLGAGDDDDFKADVFKSTYAAIATLFTEACRHDVDSFVLQTVLRGYNLNANRIAYIVDVYQRMKPTIRRCLSTIGTNSPHIVSIRWKLDYCIWSECGCRSFEPLYLIEIIASTSFSTERVIRFACSAQNLQQLVFLLKSIVKHMQRTAANALK